MQGHKNSQGEAAPYVIKSHETGKILSSHKTREEAKKHLQQMHIHGGSMQINSNTILAEGELIKLSEEERTSCKGCGGVFRKSDLNLVSQLCHNCNQRRRGKFMNFKEVKTFDALVKQAEELNIPKEELQKGIDIEKEHKDTITNIYQDVSGQQPSTKELTDAYKGIATDHEKETVDLVKEPVYYEEYLIPMENKMKEDAKEGTFKNYSSIEELIKTAQDPFEEEEEESFPEGPTKERRFRVEMYVDIFVPETDDLEADRGKATEIAEEATRTLGRDVGNAYVAKVYYHPVGGGLLGGELNE
jgi:hypothetical protein